MKLSPIYSKIIFLLLTNGCFGFVAYTQTVQASSKYNSAKEQYEIILKNNTDEYRTVLIEFSKLSGLNASTVLPAIVEVAPRSIKRALTLSKSGIARPDFRYSYTHYYGCAKPKPDQDILYALPVAHGKETRPLKIVSLGNFIKEDDDPDAWNAVGFEMQMGDTIFASRKGVVEKVIDNSGELAQNTSFTRNTNKLIIRHEDCTFAQYTNFGVKQIFVREGAHIHAGEPLGIVNEVPYSNAVQVRLIFNTYAVYDAIKAGERTVKSTYFPVTFHTKSGEVTEWDYQKTYISSTPEEIIMQEMSKREKKNWLKKKFP